MSNPQKEIPATANGGLTKVDSSYCRPLTSESQWQNTQEFTQAMQEAGIFCKGEIIADGQIHRFASGGKGDKDCWCVFYGMAGAFGDWSQGINEKWNLNTNSLSDKNKELLHAQIARAKKASEEERHQRNEDTAAHALSEWNSFSKIGTSSYLARKKVEAFGIRFRGEWVVAPLKDVAGKLWSLQFIASDGTKSFLFINNIFLFFYWWHIRRWNIIIPIFIFFFNYPMNF
jgi:phage/plasmid primase-like uncharacterized protein